MGTQRIVGLFLALAGIIGGILFLRTKVAQTNTLRVCTWSNYFPEASLEEFTAQTGIRVELTYISSNEELFAKLKAGATGFDIIQPSDYITRRLIALSMLAPLEPRLLSNLHHLDPYYLNLSYDPGLKYSVPFTFGTTGIAVNVAKVPVPKEENLSWSFLLNSPDPTHTSLLDDMREVFASVLFFKGLSPNTRELASLESAKEEITQIKNHVLMFTSEPKALLLKEELTVSHAYSVDAVQAGQENPNIRFFIPREGGIIWTDNFAIPATSPHIEQAHQFINFFLDPKNNLKVIEENLLATPNRTARLQLPEGLQKNPHLYPPEKTLKTLLFLEELGDALPRLSRMWTELKS
ncbi:spermidine/putrescine ABC transporter substrate-binding protein [bacterium]|nr:spermidine/putrescine ABC transporter substrate-binding protein [bacterium]NBX82043.1 spermidine/putrescine ABC transporter substrate-binding protein [bacterium]